MLMRSSIMCLFQKNLSSTCLEDKRAVFAGLQAGFGNICGKDASVHQFIHCSHTDKSVLLTKQLRPCGCRLLFPCTRAGDSTRCSAAVEWDLPGLDHDHHWAAHLPGARNKHKALTFRHRGKLVFSQALCLCTEFVRS